MGKGFGTLIVLLMVAVLAAVPPARAHELSLSVIELEELQDGRFAVRWPTARSEMIAELSPVFPAHCVSEPPFVDCGTEGLVGPLSFEGLGTEQAGAMFRLRYVSGETRVLTVTAAQPVVTVRAPIEGEGMARYAAILRTYGQIGVEHILLGVDHLLFVLGLVWIVRSPRMLLKTITAFTVAHSLTLAAVTFQWLVVPERLVNALIALSIVFIGVEVIKKRRGETSLTIRRPWVVAFGFGLLHGIGFAGALIDLGLPAGSLLAALLAFNLGVEVGQVGFVVLVLALGWAWRDLRLSLPERWALAPIYALGGIAAFWTAQRITVLLGGTI